MNLGWDGEGLYSKFGELVKVAFNILKLCESTKLSFELFHGTFIFKHIFCCNFFPNIYL